MGFALERLTLCTAILSLLLYIFFYQKNQRNSYEGRCSDTPPPGQTEEIHSRPPGGEEGIHSRPPGGEEGILPAPPGDKEQIQEVMRRLRVADREYTAELEDLNVEEMDELSARQKFYEIVQKPVQGVCRTLKRVGGEWLGGYNAVDGDKFVCFDTISPTSCIVYSFGINNVWSFEDLIADVGCEVWTYDPSHSAPSIRGKRIHFEQKGIANFTKTDANMGTLDYFREKNGHAGVKINYLKADVEGYEMWILPQWLRDGTLDTVDQFALELHMGGYHKQPNIKWLLKVLQDLHKLNFRIISYEANLAMGRTDGYYQYMELVWMKDEVWNYLDS